MSQKNQQKEASTYIPVPLPGKVKSTNNNSPKNQTPINVFTQQQVYNQYPQQQSIYQNAPQQPSYQQINSNYNGFAPQLINQYIPQQQQMIYQNTDFQIPYGANQMQMPIQMPMQMQIPIQMPMQSYGQVSYGNMPHAQKDHLKLLNVKEQDKDKQVVAIIVTIHGGCSYDHLFTTVSQKSQQGTRVLVYEASAGYIENLLKAYQGDPQDDVSKQLMVHVNKLHPDCVVFNWECSSNYGGQNFPQGKDNVFKFLKLIIDKGHMAMFSDFSLKALIAEWDSHLMGPNPFVKTSQTSGQFQVRFKAGQLKECPSAQLQIVGQMAQGGRCLLQAMGGTICYSVNYENIKQENYKLQVLSISTSTLPPNNVHHLQIDGHKGSAGHVLLTFPSGGLILTSMGHWIELMKIDTSEKKLFEVAEKEYGKEYAQQMQMQYANLNISEQKSWVSKNAVNFVQNQAPCSNMSKKAKY